MIICCSKVSELSINTKGCINWSSSFLWDGLVLKSAIGLGKFPISISWEIWQTWPPLYELPCLTPLESDPDSRDLASGAKGDEGP